MDVSIQSKDSVKWTFLQLGIDELVAKRNGKMLWYLHLEISAKKKQNCNKTELESPSFFRLQFLVFLCLGLGLLVLQHAPVCC